MPIEVYLTNRNKSYFAQGSYSEETFIVKKGSKISLDFASHIKGGRKAKSFRDDPTVVDNDGNVLKDCVFGSPSTAAQFVTGRSTNGFISWRVDDHNNLKQFLGK